jgi:hypothetical protein
MFQEKRGFRGRDIKWSIVPGRYLKTEPDRKETGALTGTIGILQGNELAAKDVAVSTFSPFKIYSALWVWMII